jgi:hypothetical protein
MKDRRIIHYGMGDFNCPEARRPSIGSVPPWRAGLRDAIVRTRVHGANTDDLVPLPAISFSTGADGASV